MSGLRKVNKQVNGIMALKNTKYPKIIMQLIIHLLQVFNLGLKWSKLWEMLTFPRLEVLPFYFIPYHYGYN